MAGRRYLTLTEREQLYDHITAEAFVGPMEEWAIQHPDISDSEPRHQEGIEWSLKGLRKMFSILNRYDLVPRTTLARPNQPAKSKAGRTAEEEKK